MGNKRGRGAPSPFLVLFLSKHGRPSDKPAKGKYRRLMQTRFDEKCYRKRAQVETVMSMIKRRQGSFCKGKTYWSRCRELHLMALTHNIMILLPKAIFLQSRPVPFYFPRERNPWLPSRTVPGVLTNFYWRGGV